MRLTKKAMATIHIATCSKPRSMNMECVTHITIMSLVWIRYDRSIRSVSYKYINYFSHLKQTDTIQIGDSTIQVRGVQGCGKEKGLQVIVDNGRIPSLTPQSKATRGFKVGNEDEAQDFTSVRPMVKIDRFL